MYTSGLRLHSAVRQLQHEWFPLLNERDGCSAIIVHGTTRRFKYGIHASSKGYNSKLWISVAIRILIVAQAYTIEVLSHAKSSTDQAKIPVLTPVPR